MLLYHSPIYIVTLEQQLFAIFHFMPFVFITSSSGMFIKGLQGAPVVLP